MNRSAYLTTGLAIKTLSNLSKADVVLHGEDNIPEGPVIFVINHFTRIETFLLPYYIYDQTDKPVWSLAHASLFQGGLGRFFDLVGVISTSDPKRDELIVRSLLTGEANWIIFPEGSMVKTKQVMKGKKFMVEGPGGLHRPHTGAASLALRSEIFRRYLFLKAKDDEEAARGALDFLDLETIDQIQTTTTSIVPVNLTYYPIRARENVVSALAEKMVKDLPERMAEEIMTEGTMLLSGVDIDIRFGEPIRIGKYLERPEVAKKLAKQDLTGFLMSPSLKETMQGLAVEIMYEYMADIYTMTTINHEHLFASFLKMVPFKRNCERGLRKRVFLAVSQINAMERKDLYLHKSMKTSQTHLLTDDRFEKFSNFLELALEKGVIRREGGCLIIDRSKLAAPLSFHRSRIDNPVEIMANEIAPLSGLRKLLVTLALQPNFLLRRRIYRLLWKKSRSRFEREYLEYGFGDDLERKRLGRPYVMRGIRRKIGVVLVHSYLAAPGEMKELATKLRRKGLWVYAPRLPGHGTSSRDLAARTYQEWIDEVEDSYVLMRSCCERVVFCGVSVGASLALEAASRMPDMAGVVAVCPPLKLQHYSTNFMPNTDAWNRIVTKIRRSGSDEFFEFTADNPHVNYRKNPFAGIMEVGHLLDLVESRLVRVECPALVLQGEEDPIINGDSSHKVYSLLGSKEKQYGLFSLDRHVIINGPGSDKVLKAISDFIAGL